MLSTNMPCSSILLVAKYRWDVTTEHPRMIFLKRVVGATQAKGQKQNTIDDDDDDEVGYSEWGMLQRNNRS